MSAGLLAPVLGLGLLLSPFLSGSVPSAGAVGEEAMLRAAPAEPALVIGGFSGGARRAVVSVLRDDLVWAGLLPPQQDSARDRAAAEAADEGAVLGPWRVEGSVSGPNLEARLLQPDGSVSWNRLYQGEDLRMNVHRFADDVVETLTGLPGIASTRIVYVREKSGRRELFACDYDGRNEAQLTQDRSINVGPSLSADGRILVYTGYLGGFPDLYVIDLDANDRVRLVDAPGLTSGAAISPNGGLIALAMSFTGNIEVHVVSLAGGASSRVTAGTAFSPSWSPDGRRLAVVYAGEGGMAEPSIAICGLESGAVELLSSRYRSCLDPAWSPDGRQLAYTVVDDRGNRGIVVRDLTRGTERMVAANGSEPAWSGSSRHLVFVSNGELHQIDLATDSKRTIARASGGKISEPTWSWRSHWTNQQTTDGEDVSE